MDYQKLNNHLNTDPDTRGYPGMDEFEVVTSLNTETKSRNVASMSGTEVAANIDATEYGALTEDQKSQIISLCSWNSLDPWGAEAQIVQNIFGGGSTTVANLAAARTETVTDATFYGFSGVTPGDVIAARAWV